MNGSQSLAWQMAFGQFAIIPPGIQNLNPSPGYFLTVAGQQYQWTRLPQGFHNSPTVYHQALRAHLTSQNKPHITSTIIQYVYD